MPLSEYQRPDGGHSATLSATGQLWHSLLDDRTRIANDSNQGSMSAAYPLISTIKENKKWEPDVTSTINIESPDGSLERFSIKPFKPSTSWNEEEGFHYARYTDVPDDYPGQAGFEATPPFSNSVSYGTLTEISKCAKRCPDRQ